MEQSITKLLSSFLILLVGFLISKIGSALLVQLYRKKKKTLDYPVASKVFTYAIMAFSITIALLMLSVDVYRALFKNFYSVLLNLIVTILLVFLIIMLVKFIFFLIEQFIKRSGLYEFIEDNQQEGMYKVIIMILKFIVYIVLILIGLPVVGFDVTSLTGVIKWILIPLFALLLVLAFFALKSFAENFAFGIYLRANNLIREGEFVKTPEGEGTVKRITLQGIVLQKSNGYTFVVMHAQLFKSSVQFKKLQPDLATLEKIKDNYVAQKPSYCGPASAAVILRIFGMDISQEKIGALAATEVGKGTHPNKLISVVNKITKGKVSGVWMDVTKIYSLRDELRSWLHDGAFPILDFKKSALFPGEKTAHYVVCLAVKGDDLLILDPNARTGGIYFVDYKKVQKGMDTFSKVIGGKRGYLVLAQKGTTAFYRLDEGLLYADIDLYTRLNDKLRKKLETMVKKSKVLDTVLPGQLKKLINTYKKKEKVSRVWKP